MPGRNGLSARRADPDVNCPDVWMKHSIERLPWQLAALAGLLVGAISGASGTDLWVCLMRVGEAFALFFALGLALRAALRLPPSKPAAPRPVAPAEDRSAADAVRDETDR